MLVIIGKTYGIKDQIKEQGGEWVTGLDIKELGGIDGGWKVSPEVARTYRGTGENNMRDVYVYRVDGDINKMAKSKDFKAEEAK